jgi:hypothetical protein
VAFFISAIPRTALPAPGDVSPWVSRRSGSRANLKAIHVTESNGQKHGIGMTRVEYLQSFTAGVCVSDFEARGGEKRAVSSSGFRCHPPRELDIGEPSCVAIPLLIQQLSLLS